MRGAHRWLLLAFAVESFVMLVPAKADQAFEVVQLVCAPASQYFSATRNYVDDLDPQREQRSKYAALVLTESLETKPFECIWDQHKITVRAFARARDKGTVCPAGDNDAVDISLDGKHIDCLEGAETKFENHQSRILLNADGLSPSDNSILSEHCSVDLRPVDRDRHILADEGNLRCVTNILHGAT